VPSPTTAGAVLHDESSTTAEGTNFTLSPVVATLLKPSPVNVNDVDNPIDATVVLISFTPPTEIKPFTNAYTLVPEAE
jgi:hypothetical protein